MEVGGHLALSWAEALCLWDLRPFSFRCVSHSPWTDIKSPSGPKAPLWGTPPTPCNLLPSLSTALLAWWILYPSNPGPHTLPSSNLGGKGPRMLGTKSYSFFPSAGDGTQGLYMLSTHSTTEPHPSPQILLILPKAHQQGLAHTRGSVYASGMTCLLIRKGKAGMGRVLDAHLFKWEVRGGK